MPRDRARAQLAINAPPELLERLRAAAGAQGRTVTAVVVEAIESALSGGLPAAGPTAGAQLLARVETLEAAVAQLQRPASPERVKAAPRASEALGPGQLEIIGARHLRPPEPEAASPSLAEPIPRTGDALATAELARQTGTNRRAWNAWASKAAPGDVRHHADAGGWRLIGKAPAPEGGPDRWLWERAEV
jgi:hypothetical protein